MLKRVGFIVCLMAGVAWSGVSSTASPSQSDIQIAVPTEPSSVGYLNLTKRHPDGDDGPTEFATRYSPEHALQNLDQMRGFLNSFRELTKRARGKLAEADLASAGNTSRGMQSIGFHNLPLGLEGTVLKQDYQLKQVQYDLARLKLAHGEATKQEVDRARDAYAEATKRFQLFWDTKRPVD